MNQNWIVENLNNAFSTWNGKLTELWGLVTTSPQTFKGGAVWGVMQSLHSAMVGIGYALIVLFFAISLFKNTANFHELKRPEAAVHYLIRFALCGGIAVADGELCWPLPGHTYISCHFGEVDAFGNAGHRGTDIPAPEGTPILAAHSGTVLVSGWNDSYGNQVLLDNGAGLSTRYAHMTQTAVTAGEAVTAGQVIGYVGSTGDSTGNHLHFEVMQNGVRMNPLELVFGQ